VASEDDDGSRAPKFNVEVPETNLQVPVTDADTVSVFVPDAIALPAAVTINITINKMNILFIVISFLIYYLITI
jgi:hypothetical protein